MKQFKLNSIIILISLLIIFAFACVKINKEANENFVKKDSIFQFKKTQCICQTNLNGCPSCVSDFLEGASSKSFTINWLSCVGPLGTSFPNQTSTITFCVKENSDCKKLCATLTNPPNHLPCLTYPTVFEADIQCNPSGGYYVTYHSSGIDWSLTISAFEDPKFNVQCSDGNGNFWNCVGEI